MATNPLGIFSTALATGPQTQPFDVGQYMDQRAVRQAQATNLQQEAQQTALANRKEAIEQQLDQQRRDAAKAFMKNVPSAPPPASFPQADAIGRDDEGNPIYPPDWTQARAAASNPVPHFDWHGYANKLLSLGDYKGAVAAEQTGMKLRTDELTNAKTELENMQARNNQAGEMLGGLLQTAQPNWQKGDFSIDPKGMEQAQATYQQQKPQLEQLLQRKLPDALDPSWGAPLHRALIGQDKAIEQLNAIRTGQKTEADTAEAQARTKLYGTQAEMAQIDLDWINKQGTDAVMKSPTGMQQTVDSIIDPKKGQFYADLNDRTKNEIGAVMATVEPTKRRAAVANVLTDAAKTVTAHEGKIAEETDPSVLKARRENEIATRVGTQTALANALNQPGTENETARAIAEYRQAPISPRSAATPAGKALMDAVYKINPQYDATNYQNRQKTRIAYTTGTQGQQGTQLNTMIGHVDDALDAAAAMGNGSFVPGNEIYNRIRNAFGSDAVTNFDTFKNAVAGETAKILKGVATDSEVKSVEENIRSAGSPAQLQTALKNTMRIGGSKLRALEYNYTQAFPEDKTFSILSPDSKAALTRRGFDPATMRPAAGGNAGAGMLIQVGDRRYRYNGSGDTADLKNYTEVKQ